MLPAPLSSDPAIVLNVDVIGASVLLTDVSALLQAVLRLPSGAATLQRGKVMLAAAITAGVYAGAVLPASISGTLSVQHGYGSAFDQVITDAMTQALARLAPHAMTVSVIGQGQCSFSGRW
jgi:hypothetical protein